uniref:Uncharacterized protein n=1 Tax=Tanacetum cinerariifolium TaxID=118510 RepID=A0A699H117_TANCI|nr:hypothetical protein CTI12_AA133300 [Tanacetum cinerariifolium]
MMFTFHEAYLHSKKTPFFVLWISFQLLSRGQICCVSHIESGDVYCGSGSISKDMLVRITFDVICHLFTKDFKIACSNKLQRWRLFLLILPANKEPRSPSKLNISGHHIVKG